jgi:hypothetical protein
VRTHLKLWAAGERFSARDNIFRFIVALLTLLAFTSQSIVTQTHIHGAAHLASAVPLTVTGHAFHAPLPVKAPPADDQSNCPICQGLAHAGSYVTPSAAAVAVSTVATTFSILVIDTVWIAQTRSHAWQSRAPPRG